ncbi:S1 family peptidase [Streptomyces piniterrae]|uniref:S1 family peptidase n=2 Tax=Streptomyces piniterrae TaxID=2571125 RepID=A0A4U0NTZ9_9ACTN|nr:S1 family peptidase [Streptomyces piniterrae]
MQRRFRKAALWGATVAAVMAATSPLSPARADSDPTPQPAPRGMLDAMRRDLGLTPDQARSRLVQEAEAQRAALAVRRVLSRPPAGMWFDKTAGKLVVAVTGADDAQRVRAAGAVPKTVAHSRAELAVLVRRIGNRAGDGVPGVTGWGVDDRNNGVVIRVHRKARKPETADFERAVRELGTRSRIPVRIEESDQKPIQQGGRIVGGEKWMPGTEGICSIGFSVTGPNGLKGFLTAGHCTNDADQLAYGKDGSRVGISNQGGRLSVNGREGDFGVVGVDGDDWTLTPDVVGEGGNPVAVTGTQEGMVGMSVCHSGEASGWHCGEITKADQTVDYGTVVIEGLSYTDACSAPGDSGGSYVTQPSSPKAVGTHSGGGSTTCSKSTGSGDTITIFQPIGEPLAKWDLTLMTQSSRGTPTR